MPMFSEVPPAPDRTPFERGAKSHSPKVTEYWLRYRHPTADDIMRFKSIRAAAGTLMDCIGSHTRVCADQAVAMRRVRDAVHAAEDAILLDRRIPRRSEPA